MICPKCHEKLEMISFEGVEVDRCTGCKGLWFDNLEHEKLKKMKGSEAIDIGDPKVGAEADKMGKIDCPKCKVAMIRMVDPQQPHIWFESCHLCSGVYFDAGEFRDFKQESFLDFFKGFFKGERT